VLTKWSNSCCFPLIPSRLRYNSVRCVTETSNEDGNEQCAGVVSVIVSVIVGQLDALISFVRSEAPAGDLSHVTTTIRTQQVPSSTYCITLTPLRFFGSLSWVRLVSAL
jgi:hypothetical protein